MELKKLCTCENLGYIGLYGARHPKGNSIWFFGVGYSGFEFGSEFLNFCFWTEYHSGFYSNIYEHCFIAVLYNVSRRNRVGNLHLLIVRFINVNTGKGKHLD